VRRRDFLHTGLLVPLAAPIHAFAAASTYNVREYGAKGDGKTTVTYTLTSGQFRNGQFDCNVERGRIGSNWGLSQR